MIQIPFASNDLSTDEEKEAFISFNDSIDSDWLLPIGDAFFLFCNKNVKLLKKGWENFVHTFIAELEDKYELELPELKLKFEEKEGILIDSDEQLRDCIITIIKRDFARKNHVDLGINLDEQDDHQPIYKLQTIDRFRNAVLSSNLHYLVGNKKGKNIGITKEIIPYIEKENPHFDNLSVAKITEVFNGKEKIQVNRKTIRACVLTIEEMQEYLMY